MHNHSTPIQYRTASGAIVEYLPKSQRLSRNIYELMAMLRVGKPQQAKQGG